MFDMYSVFGMYSLSTIIDVCSGYIGFLFGIYNNRCCMFGIHRYFFRCLRCVLSVSLRYLVFFFFFFMRGLFFFLRFLNEKNARTQAENSFLVNNMLWIGFFGETYTGLVKTAIGAEWGWPAEAVRYHTI